MENKTLEQEKEEKGKGKKEGEKTAKKEQNTITLCE